MTKKKTILIFFAIVALAFVLHAALFPTTLVGGDEGRYIQDALRIGDGEVPIADYTTRTPLLLWFMFISSQLFGLSLFTFRLPMFLFSALTAGFIFLLGKEMFSRNVGVVSALIYAVAPMVLWSNQLIKSENLIVLLVSVAVLMLMKGLKHERWYWFVLSGLSVGVAYIERQSAASFLVLSVFVLLWAGWQRREGFARFVQYVLSRGSLIALGFLAGFVPIFLYFFFKNSNSALELWLSFFIVNAALLPQQTAFDLYQFARGWTLTFVEAIAVQGWVLYFGAASFIALVAKRIAQHRYGKGVTTAVLTILAVPFYIHALNVFIDGHFAPVSFALTTIGGTLLWASVLWFVWRDEARIDRHNNQSVVVVLSWLASVFLVYLLYTSGYNREFLVPLSLATGVVVVGLLSARGVAVRSIVSVSLVVLWAAGAVWFSDPRTGGWWWQQETVEQAADFIRGHSEEGDVVFSASALPIIFAEREVFQQIGPYAFMLAPDKDTGWGTQPSPNEILRGLRARPPRLVLYDGRLERNFIRKTHNTELETFLKDNYAPVAQFGSHHRQDWIEVWERL